MVFEAFFPSSFLDIFRFIEFCRWLFEKYDGLRGFWNPKTKAFYSKNGNKFDFPQEVIDSMPDDIFLEGEIWCGGIIFFMCMYV